MILFEKFRGLDAIEIQNKLILPAEPKTGSAVKVSWAAQWPQEVAKGRVYEQRPVHRSRHHQPKLRGDGDAGYRVFMT